MTSTLVVRERENIRAGLSRAIEQFRELVADPSGRKRSGDASKKVKNYGFDKRRWVFLRGDEAVLKLPFCIDGEHTCVVERDRFEKVVGDLSKAVESGALDDDILVTRTGRDISQITAGQRVLVQQAVNGFTNDEIAEMNGITVSTVKVHFRAIFRKLDISRRTDLAYHVSPQRDYASHDTRFTDESPELLRLLDLLASGKTDAQIAQEVGSTGASARLGVVRRTLGFSTRNELAFWWMLKSGLIERSDTTMSDMEQRKLQDRK